MKQVLFGSVFFTKYLLMGVMDVSGDSTLTLLFRHVNIWARQHPWPSLQDLPALGWDPCPWLVGPSPPQEVNLSFEKEIYRTAEIASYFRITKQVNGQNRDSSFSTFLISGLSSEKWIGNSCTFYHTIPRKGENEKDKVTFHILLLLKDI